MMGELAPNHLFRQISQILDLGNLRQHLRPYYSHTGRPSIDPELMVRWTYPVPVDTHPIDAQPLRRLARCRQGD